MRTNLYLPCLAVLMACGGASSVLPPASPIDSAAMTPGPAWDTDNDGTVDWAETKKAASAKFDRLDVDHDGTLDAKELAAGNIDKSVLDNADKDHDGTLTKDEYLAFVQEAFKAADPDNDGTVSAAELKTKAGQALVALVK
jgi:EF hand